MNEPHPDHPYPTDMAMLTIAIDLAAQAAVRHRQGNAGAVDSKSTATDPVTEVDRDSEALIVEGIRRHRPHDAILGEEGANVRGTSGVEWIIDPLDGTVNFIYGFPQYAVSIGIRNHGVTVAAVVHDSTSDVVYSAVLGGGAFADGEPIKVNNISSTDVLLLATGFGYDRDVRARQGQVLAEILPNVRDIRRAGSAALDLCHLAAGRVDGYYETGPHPWDVAAGLLIVSEAGGIATYDESAKRVLASGPAVFESLDSVITRAESMAGMPTPAPENRS